MYEENNYRTNEWNIDEGENIDTATKAILKILNENKVSLSKTRCLFDHIILKIEDENPITL